MKRLITSFMVAAGLLWSQPVPAQCPADSVVLSSLENIRDDAAMDYTRKIERLHELQALSFNCNKIKDSVYARIAHRLGDFYSETGNIEKGIQYTKEAVAVNKAAGKDAERSYLAISYFNLGLIYQQLYLSEHSRSYLDSCISISIQFPDKYFLAFEAFTGKAWSFFHTGDYQKMIETADNGIFFAQKVKDSIDVAPLFTQKAQAQLKLGYISDAEQNIIKAIAILKNTGDMKNTSDIIKLATNYSVYAHVLKAKGDFTSAIQFYYRAFELNKSAKHWGQCVREMMNLSDLYENLLQDGEKALACINQGLTMIDLAKDANLSAGLYINMGNIYWRHQRRYNQALHYFQKALTTLPIQFSDTAITSNPTADKLKLISNDYFVITLLSSKAETLLDQYKAEKKDTLLAAALQTYQLADKAVDIMRWKQFGEQSKLFWREQTKHLYGRAMEACYLAHNSELAFFFMEKSRAVMLNDKLNELGASAYLPESEKIKEQEYRRKLLTAQQEWASVPNTTANETQPLQLLQAKEDFERYIQSLEKKYPAYYQYKYAEDVPSLQALQQYLAVDNKSFVHYFLSDTIAYMLSITPIQATLQKVAAPVFNYDQITAFLNLCADKQMLNNNYSTFAALSNKLYTALFQPLPIPDGKVIICADNFLLPFEAFCKDTQGRQFLVKEYIFSYVYSARNLLKNIASFPAEGNFIGFAPVSFQPYLDVPDLKESAISLEETANHYSHTQLFTGTQATKENFIHHIAPYRVVNVFSHASADTTFSEPLLYMQDSVIKLSELQFTPEQATRLVILSACETNVGKHAGGEGIYSLARGFASAGIPAVAATLWKADEQAIYAISKKFNQYLSQGMPKDEALQQAKLDLLTNSSIEKSLPYFWASMIIIGNTEPIKFAESTNTWWWIGAGVIACVVISLFLLWRFRRHA